MHADAGIVAERQVLQRQAVQRQVLQRRRPGEPGRFLITEPRLRLCTRRPSPSVRKVSCPAHHCLPAHASQASRPQIRQSPVGIRRPRALHLFSPLLSSSLAFLVHPCPLLSSPGQKLCGKHRPAPTPSGRSEGFSRQAPHTCPSNT